MPSPSNNSLIRHKIIRFLLLVSFSLTASVTNAQWTQTNGPESGNIEQLAVSGQNIYASLYLGGVYLSTDSGNTWASINNNLPLLQIKTMAVDSVTIIVGAYEGAFLSTDNGNTWTELGIGLDFEPVYSVALSGTNLYVGTDSVLYSSADNGTTWNTISAGISPAIFHEIALQGQNIYTSTDGGFYLSTNNGGSWNL